MNTLIDHPTRLAEILRSEGRTVAWLARQTGFTRQWVSRVVNGHDIAGEATRASVATALGRTVEDVFPDTSVRCTVNSEGQEVPS